MTQLFDIPDWHHSTTLTERIALLRARASVPGDLRESDRERLWRAQPPFADLSVFGQRLANEGLTEDEWRRVVAEPISAVHERAGAPPAFVSEFVAAYEQPAEIDIDDLLDPQRLNHRVRAAAGFLVAVMPLLAQARARLRAGLRELVADAPFVPFDPVLAERLWLLDLPGDLLGVMDRTFALELHVARMQDQLSGDTPEQRFASFVERLRDPAIVLGIFREYPVLAKTLFTCVEHTVAYGVEFFRHLVADWSTICTTFSPSTDPGRLVSLELGAGDPHRQGRTVLMLRFSSGLALVYKPKALAVDVHFQELIVWLNERGLEPQARTIEVLDRGTYGWIEVVTPTTCTSIDELHRFYQRQGALVLLAYMLGATDFHYENLLAVGEHPVLIDLETLLHPYPRTVSAEELPEGASLHRSVLRSGLLPRWASGGPGLADIDISGLGTRPGQKLGIGTPTWSGAGTDEMQFTRTVMDLGRGHNRATLQGVDVDVLDYVDDVVLGFTAAYRLVVARRDELLAPEGPIARFAHDEIRVLLRNTQRYAFLRYDANHPNVLRDALDRERVLDKLWLEVPQLPLLAKLIPSEREDLCCGDIPMFFTTPSETTLRDSRGKPIEGIYDEPSYEQVVRLIRGFGERDLEQQLWFLRTSLATLGTRTRAGGRRERPTPRMSDEPLTQARLLDAARSMGERLTRMALVDDELMFLGALPDGSGGWRFGPVDSSLYHGHTGIALFLAYLGALTGDARPSALARACLAAVTRTMESAAIEEIGVFEGWGALLYASTHLGVLWDDSELLARASAIASRIETLVDKDDRLDVVGGAAGTIVALLGLHRVMPSAEVMRAALACGDHLLRHAQPIRDGIAWPSSKEVLAPLTGFAHGSAGMAWALSMLAAATGEDRFALAAQQAITYERSTFVPGRGWPDWRKLEGASLDRPSFEAAWCHGAPGIGFARLMLVASSGDEEARAEVLTALELTLQHPHAPDHCLCHGDVGNIEFLLEAARVLEQPWLRVEAERRAVALLDSLEREGPICGLPLEAEVPGLMIGVAGIGYGLLRIAEPARVPSVLLLAPPPRG